MRTYEQYMKDAPRSHRVWAVFALMGAAGLVSAFTDLSRLASLLVAFAVAFAVNIVIWLRQNPTVKQIERRKQREDHEGSSVNPDDRV